MQAAVMCEDLERFYRKILQGFSRTYGGLFRYTSNANQGIGSITIQFYMYYAAKCICSRGYLIAVVVAAAWSRLVPVGECVDTEVPFCDASLVGSG